MAAALLASYAVPAALKLKVEVGYGHYYLPDVHETTLNKYGMPSCRQLNASLSYPFRGWTRGLRGQLLYVYKDVLGDARYVVDMHLLNDCKLRILTLSVLERTSLCKAP